MPARVISRQAPISAWRASCSSLAAMGGFPPSRAAAEGGRFPCELFDLTEILRLEKPRRNHPGAADASHIGECQITHCLLQVDATGRAENQIRQGAAEGGE